MQDDQWSTHDTVESEDERDVVEQVEEHVHAEEEDLTIQPSKISATTDKTHEVGTPSPMAPSPTTAQEDPQHELEADIGSVHSLPVVQVTEPASPHTPMTSRSASSSFPHSPTPSLTPTAASSPDRRNRHRSQLDVSSLCPSSSRARAD